MDAKGAGLKPGEDREADARSYTSELLELYQDSDPSETAEWLVSLDELVRRKGADRAHYILKRLLARAQVDRVRLPSLVQTPYMNTIPAQQEPAYPGDQVLEKRIRRLVRWNAVAMVHRANSHHAGLGGHLSTYASAASLYEVGFNHFFRGKDDGADGDMIYYQGHASPGIYARAFLEGRLDEARLDQFRREAPPQIGLSSYPHPWLMPDFWEFPTVSMGLGPIAAIYQARFLRYMHHRGIKDTSRIRVWCFVGDGESDEPESLGALQVAAKEGLDNLIFVVNCNLQRLDGPVRGNSKIIQELEARFHGAGWNVLKVIWGQEWDALFDRDVDGLLVRRMGEVVDGEYQRYSVEDGAYIREHFFGKHPLLLRMVEDMTDEQLQRLRRGGHDHGKIHAAYAAALAHTGQPSVILAKTVKGWTLSSLAGKNITHQQKKLKKDELRAFRDLLELPISDTDLDDPPYYRPPEDSPELEYLRERRAALGGSIPRRVWRAQPLITPGDDTFAEFLGGTGAGREASTTMVFARMLGKLMRDKEIGRRVVPIVPDEARTFGMETLFAQAGIYSAQGQLYEPVDHHMLLSYKERKDGQVLEEGITEAGSMASFSAAGTSGATLGESMIPFYTFYSMFGMQRTGDQVWAFGDARGKGFLMAATAGRTTLNGEGLQHEDGHSQLLASTVPNLLAWDPAYAYELAVIVQDGLRRMYADGEDIFYYITIQNEGYEHPPIPEAEGTREGILSGLYRIAEAPALKGKGKGGKAAARAQLLGSGSILIEVLRARDILAERFGVAADVWSAPSYTNLRREGMACRRWNMLHPEETPRVPYITRALEGAPGPVIASSDWLSLVAEQVSPWVPGGLMALGTDGYGRSDTRPALRRFFEMDAEFVVLATLQRLAAEGAIEPKAVNAAIKELGIDPEKAEPMLA
jgi:pyruvate dehydrogenase E1 component